MGSTSAARDDKSSRVGLLPFHARNASLGTLIWRSRGRLQLRTSYLVASEGCDAVSEDYNLPLWVRCWVCRSRMPYHLSSRLSAARRRDREEPPNLAKSSFGNLSTILMSVKMYACSSEAHGLTAARIRACMSCGISLRGVDEDIIGIVIIPPS